MIQSKFGGYRPQQPVTFRRQRAAGRIKFGGLETFGNILKQTHFIGSEQRQKSLKAGGKRPKKELSLVVKYIKLETSSPVKNQNISRRKIVGGHPGGELAGATLGK